MGGWVDGHFDIFDILLKPPQPFTGLFLNSSQGINKFIMSRTVREMTILSYGFLMKYSTFHFVLILRHYKFTCSDFRHKN